MIVPKTLKKRVRVQKGPALLGRPVVTEHGVFVGVDTIFGFESKGMTPIWSCKHETCAPILAIAKTLVVGNGVDRVVGLDSSSGRTLWSHRALGAHMLHGELLLARDGGIVIANPWTGEEIRHFDLPQSLVVNDILDDILVCHVGRDEGVGAAFDISRQRLLWKQPLLEQTINEFQAPGDVMALRAGSCTILLTKPGCGFFACSAEDGQILWQRKAFVSHDVPFAIAGRVYALTTGLVPSLNDPSRFLCLDELTGQQVYETEHKEFLAYRPSRPTVHKDHVYFGSDGGFVFALRLSDGELAWRHRTTGQTWQPTVFEDIVYVTSDDGHLLLFEGKRPPKTKRRR